MTHAELTFLIGPYVTPAVKIGDVITDVVRGVEVTVVDISNTPSPWPIGRAKGGRSPVVFEDLVLTLRIESAAAVCHW
ncbi:hypothetical protein BH11PLA2_BH11PLA2_53080 [soil metagenome]